MQMLRRPVILVAALLAASAAGTSAQAAESTTTTRILTSPPRILASVAPGAQTTASLIVVNQSRSPATLTLRASDLEPDPDDASFGILTDVGSAPRGAGAWLSIGQTSLRLGAGKRRTISIRIAVPEDTDGGGWYGAVVAETASGSSDEPGVDVRVRLVTHVNVLVPGNVQYGGRFGDVRVDHEGDGMLRVRGLWDNTGNVQSTPRGGTVRITGPLGRSRSVDLDIPETMPGGRRRFEASARVPLPAGRFGARLSATLEDGEVVRSRTVTATAWRSWVPLAFGATAALILAPIVALYLRRRRAFRRLVEAELARLSDESNSAGHLPGDESPE